MRMRVNYIKCSFKTEPPDLCLVEKIFAKKRGLRLATFPEHNARVKVSLMGKFLTHVNLTGGRSLHELKSFAIFYCQKVGTELTEPVRIDSISASERIEKLKVRGTEGFTVRKKLTEAGFTIKDNIHFPGCVLRNVKISERGTCVYFRTSGAVNYCGFKRYEDLISMHNAITESI